MKKKFAVIWLISLVLGIFGTVEYQLWVNAGIKTTLLFHALIVGCAVTLWSLATVAHSDGEKPEDTW